MDLKTPIRSQNQLVRATFQGSSFRSFTLSPRGSALVSLPAFEGTLQVLRFLPSVFLLLAGEEALDVCRACPRNFLVLHPFRREVAS